MQRPNEQQQRLSSWAINNVRVQVQVNAKSKLFVSHSLSSNNQKIQKTKGVKVRPSPSSSVQAPLLCDIVCNNWKEFIKLPKFSNGTSRGLG